MVNTPREGRDSDSDTNRSSRRWLLRSGAAILSTAAITLPATSQETATNETTPQTTGDETTTPGENRITTMGVTPEQEQFDQNLRGFWIHLGSEIDPLQAAIADECDVVEWPDRQTMAFDAMLIDRKASPEQSRITLYLHDRVEIEPGTLFIVNDIHPCPSGYVGLSLERIGANNIQVGPRGTEIGETAETPDTSN